MAGFGRSSRGKRGPSSSSSSFSSASYLTTGIFVAFCMLAVWMLTSSSIGTSPTARFATPASHGRKEAAGDEDDDAAAAVSKISSVVSSATSRASGDGEADWASNNEEPRETGGGQNEHRQQPVETNEETQQEQEQEQQQPFQDNKESEERESRQEQAKEEETHEREQMEHDEQIPAGEAVETQNEDQQQQQQQEQAESGGEENLNDGQAVIDENRDRVQPEIEEVTDESRTRSEESNMAEGNNENQQPFDDTREGAHGTETGDNADASQTQLEEKPDEQGAQMQVEEKTEEGSSESQNQEERAEGGANGEFEERTEEGTQGSQQQLEEKAGEGADGNQMQSEDNVDGSESQQQPEKEMEGEGGGEGLRQNPEQQVDEENPTGTGEAAQQRREEKLSDPNAGDSLPEEARPEMSNEGDGHKTPWVTQADHSENEKERRREEELRSSTHDWKLCNVTAGPDYIPCLDNVKALKKLHSLRHYEHRERHCPEEGPTCLVPTPKGYRRSIEWPTSRERIWYKNVPHTKLAEVKGHQNWVKVTGEYLTFPGGGTQFIHGALHYIDFIQKSERNIAWGKRTRVILDVGCGVASFGGYLFERDVLAMSFAPKDEHEAQVQMALERGIPAISAVMGSQRLPFPSRVFDIVHCARCRVPWHVEGGTLLLELNRVLRPGGYFVWSATPVYQKLKEDVEIWKAMTSLTRSMCWDLVTIQKDKLNGVGAAIYQKPTSNECYDNRKHHSPPMCEQDDDPNAAWYIPLKTCMHRVPVDPSERGTRWPEQWPRRLVAPPYWLNSSQMGVYGKPAPDDFRSDYEHWKRVVIKSYLSGMGINWSKVRNVMDMRAVYGGFAAALKDLKVWVLNVVNIDSLDTLPIIYERGLFGIYHDWCESFSTYPRSYDLLHADHLFSNVKQRCEIVAVVAEVDRIVRPGGKLIVRDESAIVNEVENLLKSLHWEIRLTFSRDQEGILCAEKSDWRPDVFEDSS